MCLPFKKYYLLSHETTDSGQKNSCSIFPGEKHLATTPRGMNEVMENCGNSHSNRLSQFLCIYISGCQKKKSSDCVVEFSDRQLFAEFDCRTFCSGNNHAEFT